MKNLKERIVTGETVHGSWVNLGSAVSAEIMANAGFDWLLIDLEHGAGNDGIMYQQLQATEGRMATVLVRTDELSRPKVQRILDAGAAGIMFPRIEDPAEAQLAASMMYYPPKGIRGMAKMIRSSGFGKSVNDYENMQKNLIGIVQIETVNAVEEIDGIARIDGVDVLFVGPSDLSMALGIFNQFDHPDYQDAINKIAIAARKHGKASGVLMPDINQFEMYHQLGYRVVACGGDAAFVSTGAAAMAKRMKEKVLSS